MSRNQVLLARRRTLSRRRKLARRSWRVDICIGDIYLSDLALVGFFRERMEELIGLVPRAPLVMNPRTDRGALVAQGFINPLPACVNGEDCDCEWHRDSRFVSGDTWPTDVAKEREK